MDVKLPKKTGNKKQETRNRNLSFKFRVYSFKFRAAFTLIELLIVITLFGLSTSLITASYLTFERNNRVKQASLTLKNDLRLIQNYALTGNKNSPPATCPIGDNIRLNGWYIYLVGGANNYQVKLSCIDISNGNISNITNKTVTLPRDVTIEKVELTLGVLEPQLAVMFEPLTNQAKFYNIEPGSGATVSSQDLLTLTFSRSGANPYKVKVRASSGQVNEEK
ncbi:type II secretion system protein [Candidatus Curtissbacteria bacterium]|nr:type II secretion system protein [Candidatus Curtissbacteria bacterium]